jgi:Cu/Ag efflux protein CusF
MLLSACGGGPQNEPANQSANAAQSAGQAPAMQMGGAPNAPTNGAGVAPTPGGPTIKGKGVITAIDATAGTITIRHEPIPELGWPTMTMMFKTSPGLAQTVSVGENVGFDFKSSADSNEIMAISKN